jgi:hypothetical protein
VVDEAALHFHSVDFSFAGDGQGVAIVRRTRAEQTTVALATLPHPGTLGAAAVPTGDVGSPCGAWDQLAAGWASSDERVFVFKLGAKLLARCGPAPVPVEYRIWIAP